MDDAPVWICMTLAIYYLASCRRLLCLQPLQCFSLCFSFSVEKIMIFQYKYLEIYGSFLFLVLFIRKQLTDGFFLCESFGGVVARDGSRL